MAQREHWTGEDAQRLAHLKSLVIHELETGFAQNPEGTWAEFERLLDKVQRVATQDEVRSVF